MGGGEGQMLGSNAAAGLGRQKDQRGAEAFSSEAKAVLRQSVDEGIVA